MVSGPIGDERLDHLFAMLMSTLANLNRSKKQRPYEQKQFLPKWGYEAPQQGPMTGDDMLRAVKRLNKQMGGTVQNVDAG
jgi:hypothetical protein